MVERKLVDNLIDEIKDEYLCKTKVTNNEYDSLNIARKTNGFIHKYNERESIGLDFGHKSISLTINANNLYFSGHKNELPELHNLIELLMKLEKLNSDQQEIDTARKHTDVNIERSKKWTTKYKYLILKVNQF